MLNLAKTIVAVPARAGSKRIPNKNLQLIGRYSLVEFAIYKALSLGVSDIYVSTDSKEISELALQLGVKPITRPESLASDSSTDLDWLRHLLKSVPHTPQNIVFLRPTSPLRCILTITEALRTFNEENSSLRSVEPISEAIEKHFRVVDSMLQPVLPISLDETNLPNQVFPKAYKANGYIDIVKSKVILEDNSVYGNKIQAYITPHIVEVDTQEELDYVRYQVEKLNV